MTRQTFPDPFYWSTRWRAVRELALRRDLYRCVICGADVSAARAARVDHIKERSNYPELELDVDNLRTLCPLHDRHAHREKTGRPLPPGTERVVRFKLKGSDVNGWPPNR